MCLKTTYLWVTIYNYITQLKFEMVSLSHLEEDIIVETRLNYKRVDSDSCVELNQMTIMSLLNSVKVDSPIWTSFDYLKQANQINKIVPVS